MLWNEPVKGMCEGRHSVNLDLNTFMRSSRVVTCDWIDFSVPNFITPHTKREATEKEILNLSESGRMSTEGIPQCNAAL